MNFSKRVIILDKLNSPDISQAIFILKDTSTSEYCAICEAERLVSEYLEQNVKIRKKHKKLPYIIFGAVFIVVALLIIALI